MIRSAFLVFNHSSKHDALKGGLAAFQILLFVSALGAISIGPVPVQWLGQVGSLLVFCALLKHVTKVRAPGSTIFYVFVLWAFVTTIVNLIIGPAVTMPSGSTTNYASFVSLRFINWFACLATLSMTSWLILNGYRESLLRSISFLGAVIAAASVYIYFAQIAGLPDIPRTRLGTGGGEVTTITFTYAFHRMLGTFREPSHLAEWLILPFFLSFRSGKSVINIQSVLIGVVILLTGSLTGIIGAAMGAVGAWWILLLFRGRKDTRWLLIMLLKVSALLILMVVVFYALVHSNDDIDVDLWQVISERSSPIVAEGLGASDRDYVYEYLEKSSIPVLGKGVGNANFEFADFLGSDFPVSFLSLYISTLFATGPVGLFLLAVYLAIPLLIRRKDVHSSEQWPVLAAYLAWLVMFSVHSEELSVMFAITYALLATYSTKRNKQHS